MDRLLEIALRLVLPIFRRSQRLQKVAIGFIEQHTDAMPDTSGSKKRRNDYEYILSRYRYYLQNKFFSEKDSTPATAIASDKRVCVVTALFGDEAQEIAQYERIDGVDYFYLSDRDLNIGPNWKKFRTDIPNKFRKSPRLSARWVKTSLPSLFGDYDLVIWIDANIVILSDIHPLIQKALDQNLEVMVYGHSQWVSLHQEAKAVIELAKDKREVVEKQLEFYRQEGLVDLPLWETPVVFAKVSEKTKEAFALWKQSISDFSYRDQLSFPYAMHQANVTITPISKYGENIRSNPFFLSVPHHRRSFPAREFRFHHLLDHRLETTPRNNVRIPFSVVVPVHGAIAQTENLINSLIEEGLGETAGDECIVVDDFSDEHTTAELRNLERSISWLSVTRNDSNLGFSSSVNKGVEISANDFVIVINSDAILPGNLLLNFSESLTLNPATVLGALSNRAGHQSLVDRHWSGNWSYFGEKDISQTALLLERLYGVGHTIAFPQIHGSLFCVERETFMELRGFDEDAFPVGYGEEVDFCLRASERGYSFRLCLSTAYHHFGSASFGNDQRKSELMRLSRETLGQRHGDRLFEIEKEMKNNVEIASLRFLFSLAKKS